MSASVSTLALLDGISNEICSVIDVAELVRNTHGQAEFRDEAERAFTTMSSYIYQVNKDKTLYSALMRVHGSAALWPRLNAEQRLLIEDLKREFEADGIHLGEEALAETTALQESVGQLETAYMQGASSEDNAHFSIGPFTCAQEAARTKAWLGKWVPQKPASVVCSSSKRIVNALLPSLDDDNVRQQVWRGAALQPAANAPVLGALIRQRQELAARLGYPSWAHKALSNSVAGSPDDVWAFLTATAEATRAQASRELDTLAALQRQLTGRGDFSAQLLQPWDLAYLTEAYKAQQQPLGPDGLPRPSAQAELSRHLSVDVAMDALADLSWELFHIRLTRQPLSRQEAWSTLGQGQGQGPKDELDAQGMTKIAVEDAAGQPVGTVYLDLYHRPHKFLGAAHFTIQCGYRPEHTTAHQLPVVALVFNFSPPAAWGPPACLSLHELETLFHEWGHALHSLLSRTCYQHLSGTRGALDFVEVPSHLFEHFAKCPALLTRWGRHHETGRPPSLALVEEALAAKAGFRAIEAQTQLLYSLADQFCFGPRIGDLTGASDQEAFAVASRGVLQAQKELTVLPAPRPGQAPSMFLLSHSHFVTYGGRCV